MKINVKKTNILLKDKISFKRRVMTNIFDYGFIFLIFITIVLLYKTLIFPSLAGLFFLMYYSFQRYSESIVYLSEIYFQYHELVIKYCFKDEEITKKIPIEGLKIDFFDSVIGNFVKCRILFYYNNQVVLKQFNIGDWSRNSLKNFKEEIQKKTNNLTSYR